MNDPKIVLRKRLRDEYRQLNDIERKNVDVRLISHLIGHDLYKNCRKIFLFASVGYEIDTYSLIDEAFKNGKVVALPKCRTAGVMEFYRYSGEFVCGKYNIPEPNSDEILYPEKGDLMIVPGLAFDKQGHRIGQGGGYYDRYLARYDCTCIGVCRERFLLKEIPIEWNDLPVDYVITETGIYQCK